MCSALEASVDVYAQERDSELMDGLFWSPPAPPAGVMGCRMVPGSPGGLISRLVQRWAQPRTLGGLIRPPIRSVACLRANTQECNKMRFSLKAAWNVTL